MEFRIKDQPLIVRHQEHHQQQQRQQQQELYDYVFIAGNSPDSFNSDVTNLLNTTFFNTSINSNLSESINGTISIEEPASDVFIKAVLSLILGLMILVTVIGNVFVIAAIILERHLQNVANYLVASLAVADLFVACLVMPLGAVYEISQGWILGPELCDIWTSCDVLCCTASILHLVAIATDRYWAVTNVDYMHSRTSRRVFTMIFLVWFAAVIVSLAPQFGWKDPEYLERIKQQKCMVSQDLSYQIFATCCTFYVPLLVILVLYWKIYQTARKRIHRRRPKAPISTNNNQDSTPKPKTKTKLKFRIASKFTSQGRSAVSSLGLVEGNSTNTVNTVEDTEDSGNEKKLIEVTAFSGDEGPTSSSSNQISTVSHHVAIQQQQQQQQQQQNNSKENTNIINQCSNLSNEITSIGMASGTGPLTQPPASASATSAMATTNTATGTSTTAQISQQQQQQHNNQISTNQLTTTLNQQSQSITSSQHNLASHSPAKNVVGGGGGGGSSVGGNGAAAGTSATGGATGGTVAPAAIIQNNNPQVQVTKRKETLEAKRERKAAKTLAIITGAFVVCWLPFFLMALLLPLCETCNINDSIASLFLWLGYFNSTLNPVIYTIFSPEFRQAFKRILFGSHNTYYRRGKL